MKVKNKRESSKSEFRKNKASGHPSHIYAKVGNDFKYLGLTHSNVTDGVKNIRLEKNPNPKDKRPAYVRPNAGKQRVNKFSKKLDGCFVNI